MRDGKDLVEQWVGFLPDLQAHHHLRQLNLMIQHHRKHYHAQSIPSSDHWGVFLLALKQQRSPMRKALSHQ